MKICPRCQFRSHMQASFCPNCGHAFSTQFSNQTQQVPPQTPPAPDPPPPLKGWDRFSPTKGAAHQMQMEKWQLEKLAYMQQNGLITPEMKKRVVLFLTLFGFLFLGFMVYTFIDTAQSNKRIDDDIHQALTNPNVGQPSP